MEVWQLIVSSCAGIITLLTFLEKIGLTKTAKRMKDDHQQLTEHLEEFTEVEKTLKKLAELQLAQNQALLALLRNDLYRCFRNNRDIAAWTDDECRVQTQMHEAYKALNGNGEEAIWWEKKKKWKIVTQEEFENLVRQHSA